MFEQKQSGKSTQSLVNLLDSEDVKVRTRARKSLVKSVTSNLFPF